MEDKYKHLSVEERDMLAVYKAKGKSLREIGQMIGRHKSTISRELNRNAPVKNKGYYLSHKAHQRANERWMNTHQKERLSNLEIRNYVEEHLKEGWSPEIIAGRIKIDQPGLAASHEAIYQYIYNDRKDLLEYLVRQHKKRQKRGYSRRHKKAHIPNKIGISERPVVVEKRERIGDWEADSIVSRKSLCALNILVERTSRLTHLSKLRQKTAEETRDVIKKRLSVYPAEARWTITYDNGSENTEHEAINQVLGSNSYFCNPYRSWEKGTVENRVGLVRRRLPKGTDFSEVSDESIGEIESWLNNRPMKCLKYKKPLEVFNELCYKNNKSSVALAG